MKKIIAIILSLTLVMSLAACGGNKAAGQDSDATSAQTGETESTQDTESTEDVVKEEFPVPENVTVTQTSDSSGQKIEFSGEVDYQTVADYIALLETKGFVFDADTERDGMYRVVSTKDNTTVYMAFVHEIRDDLFWERIDQGEVITAELTGSIKISE